MFLLRNRTSITASVSVVKNTSDTIDTIIRCLKTSATVKARSRYPYRNRIKRSGHTVLLDRFTKQSCMDGSLIAKAPIHFKCSASFFDTEGKLDLVRNHSIRSQRIEANRIEKINRRKENSFALEKELLEAKSDRGADIFLEEENLSMLRDVTDVEKKILSSFSNSTNDDDIESTIHRVMTPLQMSLYGRSKHRVDSYSILSNKLSNTYIYISDAVSAEEVQSMFSLNSNEETSDTKPSGSVSIWRPKEISQVEISSGVTDLQEEISSSLKVYCPSHLIENWKNGITMVFHTPTLMNKIYLEALRHGSIDLDGNLMDQLVTVGLLTQFGNIKIQDIWAEYIKLASNTGDILCYGVVEGHVTAETKGDGDFIARSIVGPRLKVTTDAGDICLWDDCHSEVAELFTEVGNVHCKRLYGNTKILVKEQGTASFNVVSGSIGAVVKSGDVIAHMDNISEDSFIEVGNGHIILYLPPDFTFRVTLTGPRTSISPHILNAGEFYLEKGMEYFVSGVEASTADITPTLTVKCHEGQITLKGPRSKKNAEKRSVARS